MLHTCCQVACEALGRMPNWQAAVDQMKHLTALLQDTTSLSCLTCEQASLVSTGHSTG